MSKTKPTKRFRYNLASALRVRIIRETLQKEEVTKATQKLQEEQIKLEEIITEQNQENRNILEMYHSGKPIDLSKVFLRKHRLEVLKENEVEQCKEVEKAQLRKLEEERKLLIAIKEKKILEKDKEKKRKIWRKLLDKEETKFLDDISTSRFFRARPVIKEN